MIDYKKHNLTIIDDTNIREIVKIDKKNSPNHNYNYYDLIEEHFVYGRLIYNKTDGSPLFYWFCKEEIDNYLIVCWNTVLQIQDSCLIMVGLYRDRCIELGNTLSFYVQEKEIDTCNYLKNFRPQTKMTEFGIEFKFFGGYQNDWLNKELHVQIYKEYEGR